MTFKLEFRTDSAAFNGDPTDEISRILWQITGRVKTGGTMGVIRDINGNVIGKYEIEED